MAFTSSAASPARPLAIASISIALLPCAMACLLFLAGCGGGSEEPEPTYVSTYPALAAHASMDEEDFNRYLLYANKGTAITPETIKSLSVGSSIDSAASTYNLRPIFDLGRLRADGWLDVDTTRSQEKTELQLKSNKKASSESSQTTIDGSASGSFAGFKAAAAYHQANAWQRTNSDGSISVQMVSANTNNFVSILNSGFTGSENLTPYLIGTKLTDEQLRSYVSVTQSAPSTNCGGQSYITGIAVNAYKMADAEPYANVQLLTRMETIFADLKAQHDLCANAAVKAQTILQMTDLRGKIESAIADFYAVNGDSFVSRTASMNQGIGKGTLTFNNNDGSTEAQYGASLSAEYQALTTGIGATGAFQYYKQNGWATAFQNVQVSAEAKPAGVADTTAWVSSLYTMLKDQSSSVVPPMGSLPKDPGVKLPEPVGPRKSDQEPPDSVFTSYDQWKQYQQDKKKGVKDEDALERAINTPLIVRLDDDDDSFDDENSLLQGGQAGNAYLRLIAELDELKQRAKELDNPPQAGAASDGNLVRFDKMFVNGFETVPYDAVIPQLRPNLDIPGVDKIIGSFPQLMQMMLIVEKLGQLDSYQGFLANLSVSNVTPGMSGRYHLFFQKASARAYDLVGLSLAQGADITPAVLTGYKKAMFGTVSTKAQSELYKSLQDMDYYDYIVDTLLDPIKGKAWTAAPGGYIPMRWAADGSAQLVSWTSLARSAKNEAIATANFTNPNADPLSLYRGMNALQTPWYPVYIFNQGNPPALVFVQNFGAYQAIYGPQWVVRPYDSAPLQPSLRPLWPDYQALGHEINGSKPMRDAVASGGNSFLTTGTMSWDYSLYFPQSGSDPSRLRKFNVLVISPKDFFDTSDPDAVLRYNAHSAASRYIADYNALDDATYGPFRNTANLSTKHLVRRMGSGEVVDIDNELMITSSTNVMLLPLNATTAGESLKQAFNYAPERAPMDIVTPTSLDLVNKLAVLLQ